MRSRLAALAALTMALLTVALVPTPAAALSCVATAERTPVELVSGAPLIENAEGPQGLFDVHDYVVVARVTAIRPPAASSEASGPVSVDLEVLAVVNRSTTGRTVTVTMADHGEMSGYAFEVGKPYFVVMDNDARLGVCGPTSPLDAVDRDPSRAVALLQAAARKAGVPFALPSAATPTPAAAAPVAPAPSSPGSGPAPAALVAGSMAGLVAGGLVLRRRRRTATGDAA